MSHTIEEIREAFNRVHRVATKQPRAEPYMSIPPNPQRDADFVVHAAIDELEQLRLETARLAPFERAATYWKDNHDREKVAREEAEAVQQAQEDRARELIAEADARALQHEAEAAAEAKLGSVLADELAAEKVAHLAAMKASTPADRAVMTHLVRLIQDSADVRYYVGGWGSQMRELLVAALTARGVEQPLEVLKPAPHHADDEPRVKRLERALDELRAAARAACFGHHEEREKARPALESLL